VSVKPRDGDSDTRCALLSEPGSGCYDVAGEQQPGHDLGLVPDRHPHVDAGPPRGRVAARSEGRDQGGPSDGVRLRRLLQQELKGRVSPQRDDQLLEQRADPAGRDCEAPLHPADGGLVAGDERQT